MHEPYKSNNISYKIEKHIWYEKAWPSKVESYLELNA